jgi:hypothetical protein
MNFLIASDVMSAAPSSNAFLPHERQPRIFGHEFVYWRFYRRTCQTWTTFPFKKAMHLREQKYS